MVGAEGFPYVHPDLDIGVAARREVQTPLGVQVVGPLVHLGLHAGTAQTEVRVKKVWVWVWVRGNVHVDDATEGEFVWDRSSIQW